MARGYLSLLVFVLFGLFGSQVAAATSQYCPSAKLSPVMWSSYINNSANGNVTIPANITVVLDVANPPAIFLLHVYGNLIFSDDIDISINVNSIYVWNGGHLWIGAANCTHKSLVTITLHGDPAPAWSCGASNSLNCSYMCENTSNVACGTGKKGIIVLPGGQLDVFGAVRTPTWTVLQGDILPGSSSFKVAEAVEWAVGDEIVISSTDYGFPYEQHERFRITKVQQSGRLITINGTFRFFHYGHIWTGNNGDYVDMRAEVGLLTRNVVIRGDVSGLSGPGMWGGHVMCKTAGCQMRIVGAEFVNMGQNGTVGRYPIHYHLAQDQHLSYAIGNSVHDTFQRCITVHGSDNVVVQDNVAFNGTGHCYFLEDGDEVNNTFAHNLGIFTKEYTLLESDSQPAMYWVSNPMNNFIGNVAVGGTFGFWLISSLHPTGLFDIEYPGMDWKYWPQQSTMGVFLNNTAHSCQDSGFFDKEAVVNGTTGEVDVNQHNVPSNISWILQYYQTGPWNDSQLNFIETLINSNPFPVFDFVIGATAYKNRDVGIWFRSEHVVVINAHVSDNLIGVTLVQLHNLLYDSVIVGDSDNIGTPGPCDGGRSRPWFELPPSNSSIEPIFGVQNYDGLGSTSALQNRIYNFMDTPWNSAVRKAGAFFIQNGDNVNNAELSIFRTKLTNVSNYALFMSVNAPNGSNAVNQSIIIDSDGTLSGVCGNLIVGIAPTMWTPHECTHNASMASYVCPPPYFPIRQINAASNVPVHFPDAKYPKDYFTRVNVSAQIVRLSDLASTTIQAPSAPANSYANVSWPFNLMMFNEFYVAFGQYGNLSTQSLSYQLTGSVEQEWIRIAVAYPYGTVFSITQGRNLFTQVNSKGDMQLGTYYVQKIGKVAVLWLQIQTSAQKAYYTYFNRTVYEDSETFNVNAVCPNNYCYVANFNYTTLQNSSFPDSRNKISWCEEYGPRPLDGENVWLPNATPPLVVFDDTYHNAKAANPNITFIQSNVVASGSSALQSSITPSSNSITILFTPFAIVNTYTHIEFDIRVGPDDGEPLFTLSLKVNGSNMAYSYTHMAVPDYTTAYPISGAYWSHIRIPLADLGVNSTYYAVDNFSFNTGNYPLIKHVYLDNIQFASYSTKVQQTTSFVPSVPTPPDYSWYTNLLSNPPSGQYNS